MLHLEIIYSLDPLSYWLSIPRYEAQLRRLKLTPNFTSIHKKLDLFLNQVETLSYTDELIDLIAAEFQKCEGIQLD
jgi:hypothetical protein